MATNKPSSSQHSKKKQNPAFPPVHDLKVPMTIGNQQYVPEPPNEKEKDCIYKSQVLIPILVSGNCHAMLGPLPNLEIKPDRLKEFFPSYFHTKPIGAGRKPQPKEKAVEQKDASSSTDIGELDLTYLNYPRIFRTCPWSKDPSDYVSWLDKIEKVKGAFWKEVGIFDLIQLSRVGPNICPNMLLASLYFWDSTYNTFHLPCGMVTPTLFDAAAIVGLHPNGIDFDPTVLNEDTIAFETSLAPYSLFMSYYHDKSTTEVLDVEHIAFLTLWLSKYVFCSRSLQVAKRFITIANQLHAGTKLCLSEMILANLYESLSESVHFLKNTKTQGKINLSGPFWLLQLWLNATFEANLPVAPEIDEEEVKNRTVEWPRLVLITPSDEGISLRQAFKSYVMMFAKSYQFTSTMAPFADRKIGPRWFTQQLPLEMQKDENIFLNVWESFLTPRLLFSYRNTTKNQIALIVYQPNLVSRQFGLIQIKPQPIFPKKGSIIFYNSLHTKDEGKELSKKLADDSLDIRPVIFRPSFLCTPEFDEWWKDYYSNKFFDVAAFATHLTNAFAFVQDRTKKGIQRHIKEIQKFQKYFETAYRPDDLSRTICEAAAELKRKLTEKFEKLSLPSNLSPEARYDLAFSCHPPKFPPLPTADFGVAFSFPLPDWFLCGDFMKILRQKYQKPTERVVPTKYHLGEYPGHLHIGIEHVRVEDPILEAVKIPAKKAAVEATPSTAKKPSTKVSRKPPTIQKKRSEEERGEDKVPNEESGDESPEKDSASTPPAKPQSKDTGSGKSGFNTEIPEEQVAVESTPEKILEETAPEEGIPTSDHDMQTVAEFDTTLGEASEDESPPHPGLNVAPQGDDIDMEVVVEDDPEDGAARDGDNQSKHTEVEHTSTRNTPPAPDRAQGSSKSTGSTSFSREELENLKVQRPLEYLKAMLSTHFNFQDSSQSSSTTSGATSEAPSLGNILTKIKTKILDVDLFKVLEENSLAHIDLKKILKQVNVLEASAEIESFVMELMTLIDLATADLHRQRDLTNQISSKFETQTAEWEAVSTSTDKVSKLQKLSETCVKEVAACDDNIHKCKTQMAALQEKISQEEKRKASIQQPKQSEIDEELGVGIRHAEKAQQLSQEIETLSTHKSLCDHRLQFQRQKFATLKDTFANFNL
ncbi:hypothetical protein KIW84_011460 [Lathyrus oleraceus]|uniref:Aminotransferase-like plant mobile domain-containing protein n=1 Tax=Pisum sativum TaxID=3888 RepID=A0A9D5BEZ1_PEA|nr:hypothetical protein KIW84_011460 [Pisum sativum]